MSKMLRPRNIVLVIGLLIIMAVSYGFAAQNTLTVNPLGDATATVSGYVVTVAWDFYSADSDPSDVEDADLTFVVAPNEVYVRFFENNTSTWSAWVDCGANGILTSLTCAVPAGQAATEYLTQIQVAAR